MSNFCSTRFQMSPDLYSTTHMSNRVESWLSEIETETERPSHFHGTHSRKRKSEHDQQDYHRTTEAPTRKRKRLRQTSDMADENTPRQVRTHSQAFYLTYLPPCPSKRTSSRSSANSTLTGSSRAASSRASPVKMLTMRSLDRPIEMLSLPPGPRGLDGLPSDLVVLIRKIRAYAKGIGTVPDHLREAVMAEQEELWQEDFVGQNLVSSNGRSIDLREVDHVVETSLEYQDLAESEAAWNAGVHSLLGRLSLDQAGLSQSLRLSSITTARISTNALLPNNYYGVPINSKMVDYAIALWPNEKMKEAHRRVEPIERGLPQTFNQTSYLPIAQMPIAINIVTKAAGEGEQVAFTQLSTWILAQYSRLQLLLQQANHTNIDMPFLPLLFAQGPRWFLFFAKQFPDNSTTIWNCQSFGDSTSRHGVCQIVATIQLLMQWADTDYRNWFEDFALPSPLPGTS